MKTIFKTINLILLGIFIMPSFLLLVPLCNTQQMKVDAYYCDNSYSETGTITYTETYIEYDTYSINDVLMNRFVPTYENATQLNSCAPMAATIVIGYYDYLYENLVPNASVGMMYNNKYYYTGMNDQLLEIKENLYTLMGTNTEAPGTSVNQFINGFTSYVDQQGYNISFSSCGALNLNTLQSHILNQTPVVVFLNSYTYYSNGIAIDDGTKLTFLQKSSNNGHVAVCYGYREIYFTKDGNSWTEKYIVVSFGDGSAGLINVNSTSSIDASYAVSIY